MINQISSSIVSLRRLQERDGTFVSYSSADRNGFIDATRCDSLFVTAIISGLIAELPHAFELPVIKSALLYALYCQRSINWTFNYWLRGYEQSKQMPYPDDWDDTACAIAALKLLKPEVITGKVLAQVIQALTACEVEPGGPYRTWLVSNTPDTDPAWLDVDLAVNANIGYMLSLFEVEVPGIIALVKDAIQNERYVSPYYPTPFPIMYFISRWYRGELREQLGEHVLALRKKDGSWGNPLHTALAMLTLVQLDIEVPALDSAVAYLERTCEKDHWRSYPFYIGINPHQREQHKRGVREDGVWYAGSPALTTAFCAAALASVMRFGRESGGAQTIVAGVNSKFVNGLESQGDIIIADIRERLTSRCAVVSDDLRDAAGGCIKRFLDTRTGRGAALAPYEFYRALREPRTLLGDKILVQLGVAMVFGWVAYTIIDSFLDVEGEARQVSIGTFALRALYEIMYELMGSDKQFVAWFYRVMDGIDGANMTEVGRWRRQADGAVRKGGESTTIDFDLLARRSLGHTVGPMALMCLQGYGMGGIECRAVEQFFSHYLIARQLNDDAHDWEADLERGQYNAVSLMMLRDAPDRQTAVDLRDYFWHEAVVGVSKKIFKHLKKAREVLRKVATVLNSRMLDELLLPIEHATQRAIEEREQVLGFLEGYGKGGKSN